MARKGRLVTFHGAFATKAKAKTKERKLKNAYILKTRVKGQVRFLVLKRRSRG